MTRHGDIRARGIADVQQAVMRSKLRIFGVALVCAKVALVPLAFDHDADIPFGVTKGMVSHGLAYVLAGVLVGLFVQFGRHLLVRSWLHVPVLVFFGVNVASTVFAVDPFLALYGTHERMLGIGTIADGRVLYSGVVLLIRKPAEVAALIVAALGAGAAVLGYELVQFAGRDPFGWSSDVTLRPFSTLGQTNSLAEYLTVLSVCAVALALFAPTLPAIARLVLLLYAAVAIAGIAITLTRSSLLGIVAGCGVLVLLTWLAHPNRRARTFSLIGAAASTALVVVVLLFTPLGARFLSTVEISSTAEGDTGPRLEAAVQTRVALYGIALEMIRARPVLGFGPDNFIVGVPRYRSDDEPPEVQASPATSAHGWPAQVAATTGVAGLLAYIAIDLVAVWLTVRAGYRPMAWVALAGLAAFLGAGITTVNAIGTEWIFWVTTGAVAASTAAHSRTENQAEMRPRGRSKPAPLSAGRWPIAIACVLIAVAVAATTPTALVAARSSRGAQILRLQGRFQPAIDLALNATRADPGRPEYWESLGLAYVAAEQFRAAAASFEEAVKIAPYDVRYYGNLARAYAVLFQRGDATAGSRARDVAERAVQTDKNNPLAHLTKAVVMQVLGDLPGALTAVERALALDKSNDRDIYLTATQILRGLGRFTDAITLARRAIALMAYPQDTVAIRIELARSLLAGGDPTSAISELDAALAIRPNDSAAQQLRAQIRGGATP